MLNVKQLHLELEGNKILKGITLKVNSGEILAILGRSGSGKSTLLKSIAGLLEFQGSIYVDKERLKKPSEKLIPGHEAVKIVRQDNPLFPNISLAENIAYPLRFYQKGYQKTRVRNLVTKTGIKKVQHMLPRNVSEGEQQRAIIATSLALEPKVLLLDEPFSNLDPENKESLREEIRAIVNEENIACVFVTHDISDVFGNADRLAILKNGRITQRGRPEEIYNKPKSEYEARLTGRVNSFQGKLCRPEHVLIAADGSHNAYVLSSHFFGSKFHNIIRSGEDTLLNYTTHPLEVGSPIRFYITQFIDHE